ncbi:MAG: hypothetical protein HY314_03670 [Acidobacteria bacterium]|nr:hypothetical protein [Acidobacteriota bacterium]
MAKMRWVNTTRLLIITLMLTTAIVGYSRPGLWEQTRPAAQLPQFGEADGFACVLFYGSDIDGNLEPCG